MRPEILLQHFPEVAEAPNAVDSLRRSLIKLVTSGRLAKPSSEWKECTLSDCVTVWNGRAYKQQELLSAGTPVLRIQNLNGGKAWYYSNLELGKEKYCGDGDLLYAWSGTFGPYIWRGPTCIYHYHIWKLEVGPGIDKRFLYYLLSALTEDIKTEAHGLMLPHMTKSRMESWPLLLPPPEEQKRVVETLDRAVAICSELEAAQAKRERRRDRLVAATLHGLNNGEASAESGEGMSFQETARFYFNHLPRLITRPEHIQQLRNTISNFAFRGLLVPQDEKEGTGADLLQRICNSSLKGSDWCPRRSGAVLDPLSCPGEFEIPRTWAWSYLGFICSHIADVDHKMPKAVANGVPFISAKDLKDDGTIDFSAPKMISEEDYARLSRKLTIQRNDIVYSRIGAKLGKARLVTVDLRFMISYSCCLVRPMHEYVDAQYIQRFLDSNVALMQAQEGAQGIGVPDLGLGQIRLFRIPLPPASEQRRIAAKIDELMALCAGFELRLIESEHMRRSLLEATLQQALGSEVAATAAS